MPLGEVVKWNDFLSRSAIYTISAVFFGAVFGFLFTIIIYLFGYWFPDLIKYTLLLGLLIAYVFHELGIIKLKVPQHHWQIPESWVNYSPKLNMFIWGIILGPGIFTYIPHSTFYILYLYIGLFNEPIVGFIFGAVYGLSRVMPSIILSGIRNTKIGNQLDSCKISKIKNTGGYINAIVLIMLAIQIILINIKQF